MTVVRTISRNASAVVMTLIMATTVASLTPCGAVAQEHAVAPEVNPPGDIPDNQQFVTFVAKQGASLKVPEGWGRTDTAVGALFADKYNRIELTIQTSASALTMESIRSGQALELQRTGHAVHIAKIERVRLPAGPGVRITYTSNSEPNAVTGKKIRLENERFYLSENGKVAELTFSAPAGADNADQWALMSKSFRWK